MASPREAAGHQPAPEQQAEAHRVVAFAPFAEARRQAAPRVLSPAALLFYASEFLTADEIRACLEREGPIQPGEIQRMQRHA
jgi:hypothetical protein